MLTSALRLPLYACISWIGHRRLWSKANVCLIILDMAHEKLYAQYGRMKNLLEKYGDSRREITGDVMLTQHGIGRREVAGRIDCRGRHQVVMGTPGLTVALPSPAIGGSLGMRDYGWIQSLNHILKASIILSGALTANITH